MDLGNPRDFKTYIDSDKDHRTQDFIAYLQQVYYEGVDFVFIQELACYENLKMVYEALQSRKIKFFYHRSMLPSLKQKWQ
jgi:hypothetical protein